MGTRPQPLGRTGSGQDRLGEKAPGGHDDQGNDCPQEDGGKKAGHKGKEELYREVFRSGLSRPATAGFGFLGQTYQQAGNRCPVSFSRYQGANHWPIGLPQLIRHLTKNRDQRLTGLTSQQDLLKDRSNSIVTSAGDHSESGRDGSARTQGHGQQIKSSGQSPDSKTGRLGPANPGPPARHPKHYPASDGDDHGMNQPSNQYGYSSSNYPPRPPSTKHRGSTRDRACNHRLRNSNGPGGNGQNNAEPRQGGKHSGGHCHTSFCIHVQPAATNTSEPTMQTAPTGDQK